jgi:hypothetical protein
VFHSENRHGRFHERLETSGAATVQDPRLQSSRDRGSGAWDRNGDRGFSVVNQVLLNPFGYPDPERIVMFQNTYQQFPATGSASPTEFNWWRQQTGAFQDVSAYVFGAANVTGESIPKLIRRTFSAADDVTNAPGTAVLAYGYCFEVFNIPVVRGRTFTDRDDSGARAMVINESLAQRFWPNGDPTNDRLVIGTPIVGFGDRE